MAPLDGASQLPPPRAARRCCAPVQDRFVPARPKRVFKHAAFKFIEYRRIAYGISVVVLILGVSSFFHGFRKGVEFQGGRSYVINFHRPVSTEAVRHALETAIPGSTPEIKTYGGLQQLEITTDYKIKDTGNTDAIGLAVVAVRRLVPETPDR